MNIVNTPHSRVITVPIYGASADVASGAMIMAGATAETNLGVAIKNSAASNLDAIGVLMELHDYSKSGDALVAGATYWSAEINTGYTEKPMRKVSLLDTAVIARVDYDLTSTMAIASMGSTTSIVVTSIEDNIDTSFLYCYSGTGAGQMLFCKSDDGTNLVITSAPTVGLVAADTLVKILRLFHNVVVWTAPSATAPTKLGTTAAAGTGRAMILKNVMFRNGLHNELDPKAHHNLQDLDGISDFGVYSLVQVLDTVFHRLA